MKDLKNILSTDENTFLDEELVRLMQQDLHPEEEKEINELLQQDSFIMDAMEGLRQSADSVRINQSVLKLNKHLERNILARPNKRKKKVLPSNQWTIIAVIIILFFCLLGYFIIALMHHKY